MQSRSTIRACPPAVLDADLLLLSMDEEGKCPILHTDSHVPNRMYVHWQRIWRRHEVSRGYAWRPSRAPHHLATLRALLLKAWLPGNVWHLMVTFRADALPTRTGGIGSPHTTKPASFSSITAPPSTSSPASKHGYTSCFPLMYLTYLREPVIYVSPSISTAEHQFSKRYELLFSLFNPHDPRHDRDEHARRSPGKAQPGSCCLPENFLPPSSRFR